MLTAEARLRAHAGDVLLGAAPATAELPAFPTVDRPAARRRRRAWVPLAWAASVLVAAGAGWLGSELWRTQSAGVLPTEAGMTADASPAPPAADEPAIAASPPAANTPAGRNAPAGEDAGRAAGVAAARDAASPAPPSPAAPVEIAPVEKV